METTGAAEQVGGQDKRSETSTSEPNGRRIMVEFGDIELEIELDSAGRFVAVRTVTVKKSFLTPAQRLALSGDYDVDEYYENE